MASHALFPTKRAPVRGPVSATLAILKELGWRHDSFSLWCDDRNQAVDLTKQSPMVVLAYLKESMARRSLARGVAQATKEITVPSTHTVALRERGLWIDAIRDVLRSNKKLNADSNA